MKYIRKSYRSISYIIPLYFILGFTSSIRTHPRVDKLLFFSCFQQKKAVDLASYIFLEKPDIYLFLGDNVYPEGENLEALSLAYKQLNIHPFWKGLKKREAKMFAIWDDHDYGINDGGAENPFQEASKELFLETFSFPPKHPLRNRKGLYYSEVFGEGQEKLRIIFLDTRTFRTPLKKGPLFFRFFSPYIENWETGATFLGNKQWEWLESELQKEEAFLLLISGIQVLPYEHHFERWENFPLERLRLLNLLEKYQKRNLLILSGDRHFAEISRFENQNGFRFLELTSSSLNKPYGDYVVSDNRYRLGNYYSGENYGTIQFDWKRQKLTGELKKKGAGVINRIILNY